jgi:hypothetical protein
LRFRFCDCYPVCLAKQLTKKIITARKNNGKPGKPGWINIWRAWKDSLFSIGKCDQICKCTNLGCVVGDAWIVMKFITFGVRYIGDLKNCLLEKNLL